MGFFDSVNDNTNVPAPSAFISNRDASEFSARVLDVKIKKSENKKNKSMYGHELFIVELEVLSGTCPKSDGTLAQPGEQVTHMIKLPKSGEDLNAGYVVKETADLVCGIAGIPRTEFRGTAPEIGVKILNAVADGIMVDKTVFVTSTPPNEDGYVRPVFENIEEAPAKKSKKSA